jgi:hypothetical protein
MTANIDFLQLLLTFDEVPKNQLIAKKHVTLALMVPFSLFRLYKLKNVLYKFTDDWQVRVLG